MANEEQIAHPVSRCGEASARHFAPLAFLCGAAAVLALASPGQATSCSSLNASNFNGTPISGADTIWFNAIATVKGIDPSTASTVTFSGSSLSFTAGGTAYQLLVPASTITFSPTASQASTTYDATSNSWSTTVPARYSGNVFLSGLAFSVPAGGLPGGINPVTWSGAFASATSGLTVQWQWGAAVYTQFPSDYNAAGVKPIDGGKLNPYLNSDHAGTPESYGQFVTGGARGGGGSNFTGSYSGTVAVVPCGTTELTLQMAFASSPICAGSSSSLTISVTNAGSQTSQDLEVADFLGSALQLNQSSSITVTQGSGSCLEGFQAFTCLFPSLAPGETLEITVVFSAEFNGNVLENGGVVENTATATDAAGDTASSSASVVFLFYTVGGCSTCGQLICP